MATAKMKPSNRLLVEWAVLLRIDGENEEEIAVASSADGEALIDRIVAAALARDTLEVPLGRYENGKFSTAGRMVLDLGKPTAVRVMLGSRSGAFGAFGIKK
ncbi:MAG: hypothetical protein U0Q03_13605 [Acidimicrobiales bacterium]